MYYAYGIFDNVNLEAQNGALTVSGEVTQPFKKTDIGNILERVKGVAALQNNLEVLPTSMFDDRLRLQLARAIYGNPFFTPYRNLALPPIHIIVKNGNVTLEGRGELNHGPYRGRDGGQSYRALLLRREQSSGSERLRDWLNFPPLPALRKFSAGNFFEGGEQAHEFEQTEIDFTSAFRICSLRRR